MIYVKSDFSRDINLNRKSSSEFSIFFFESHKRTQKNTNIKRFIYKIEKKYFWIKTCYIHIISFSHTPDNLHKYFSTLVFLS